MQTNYNIYYYKFKKTNTINILKIVKIQKYKYLKYIKKLLYSKFYIIVFTNIKILINIKNKLFYKLFLII